MAKSGGGGKTLHHFKIYKYTHTYQIIICTPKTNQMYVNYTSNYFIFLIFQIKYPFEANKDIYIYIFHFMHL